MYTRMTFFRVGGMPSVPPLPGQRCFALVSAQTLRMTDRLVAIFAYTNKVSLVVAVGVLIPDVQRLVRCILNMIDVMDQLGASISAALFADLALVLVHLHHTMRELHPLSAAVKRMHITGCNQAFQPVQQFLSHDSL